MRDEPRLHSTAPPLCSQSTKLSVHEDRVMRMAELTRGLPSTLAHEGKVKIRSEDIAKLVRQLQGRLLRKERCGAHTDDPATGGARRRRC